MPTLIHNIGTLQTPLGSFPHAGAAQGENRKYHNAAVLCDGGVIRAVYENGALPEVGADTQTIDAQGRLVTPGLIDAHAHLVFGGWRQNEIPLKLKGAGYLDILRAGGGILSTVRATRKASEEELFEKSRAFLDEMLAQGVTSAEIKSGYGLDMETELKQLRVIKRLNEAHPMDAVATYLGAHAIPEKYRGKSGEYIDFIISDMLPEIKRRGLAEFCDVFLETGVFGVEESRRLLTAAREMGFGLKIHADEIDELGGSQLAGELGAVSAEHLIATGERGMEALARGGVIAALLPCTSLYLNKSFARARDMIARGIPVAVATDFNPGSCPSLNIGLCMTMAYLKYRMTPEEILSSVTINAACAVNRGGSIGTIEPGKKADMVIWNAEDMEMLCYRMGSNLAGTVIKHGAIVKNNI
jgi:imidazolonepropionase